MIQRDGCRCTFRMSCLDADWVALAGEFNQWNTGSHFLTRLNNQEWEIVLELRPGTYRFRYLVSGERWLTDYAAFGVMPNGMGEWDSIVFVPPCAGSAWREAWSDGHIIPAQH